MSVVHKTIKCLFVLIYIAYFGSNNLPAQQALTTEQLPQLVQRFFPVVYHLDDDVPVTWNFVDSVYVASFTSETFPVKVFLKENGFWIKTLWQIEQKFVPQKVMNSVASDFPQHPMARCFISNNPFHEVYYYLHLQKEDQNGFFEVIYTSEGKQISP